MVARTLTSVPKSILVLLFLGLGLQIGWHNFQSNTKVVVQKLNSPLAVDSLRIASLGDPIALGKLLMMWLQAFDYQPGVSIPLQELDYDHVTAWLGAILRLDPKAQYALLSASRLYAEVLDKSRKRKMLDFVYKEFLRDPNRRWRWLAHCTIIAQYQLNDLPMALKFSRAIADKTSSKQVPHWAQQLSIVILEDMGELESARVLIGGLLADGEITDQHEINFLNTTLKRMEQ